MRRTLILLAVVLILGGVGVLLGVCGDKREGNRPGAPSGSEARAGPRLEVTFDRPLTVEELLADLGAGSVPQPPPPAPKPGDPAPAAPAAKADLPRQTIDLGGGVTFEMVRIPAGEFDMGSPETEEGREKDETLHRVRITKPFWLATTETTQAVWEKVTGANPPEEQGPTLPVADVSWDDCQAFVKRLNEKVAGGRFRLPTEAEWEYSCRAGSRTAYSFGDFEKRLADYAWQEGNAGKAVHPVGLLKPNAWGLFDMHGNVWEWCQDVYGEYPSVAVTDPTGAPGSSHRVARGGGWRDPAWRARAAFRNGHVPGVRFGDLGLRLARAVAEDAPPPPAPGNAPPAPPPAPKPGDPAPPAPPAKNGDVPSWAKVAPEQVEAARKAGVPVAFENSIGMRFVLIPAGTFVMGSPETEEGRDSDETQHDVRLTRPYYLQTTETTNGQYRRFKQEHHSGAYEGSSLNGDDQPVVEVSWDDATAFAAWLTARDRGRTYRLPTEAERERACRAGTTGRWSFGEDEAATGRYANVADRTARARWEKEWTESWPGSLGPRFVETDDGEAVTAKVGHYLPNAYGLYDMAGNVWEWCQDGYGDYASGAVTDPTGASGSGLRVARGGCWLTSARYARSACRDAFSPVLRGDYLGFRLARAVAADEPPPQAAGAAPPAPPVPPPWAVDEARERKEEAAGRELRRIHADWIEQWKNGLTDEQLGRRLIDFLRDYGDTTRATQLRESPAEPYPKMRALIEKARAAGK